MPSPTSAAAGAPSADQHLRPVMAMHPVPRAGRWLLAAAVALAVFGSRAWLLQAWGSPVPYWDQWDGEALRLYKPWLEGTFDWRLLLAPHNEHRIALTRLADLAMLSWCGGWNTWVQLGFNAALHALTSGLITSLLLPTVRRLQAPFALGVAVLFSAPSDWGNALWGFQSAFYLQTLLAAGAIATFGVGMPFSGRWWLGCTMALLSLFTTGAGLLAAVAVVAMQPCCRIMNRTSRIPRATLVAAGAIALLGAALLVSPPQHAIAHAKTLPQFWAVFTRCLAWPMVHNGAWAIAMQLPVVVLLVDCWRRRELPDVASRIAIGIAIYTVLHSASLAFARGGELPDHQIYSRYHGPLVLGAAAQLFIACTLAASRVRVSRLLALAWAGMTAMGLLALSTTQLSESLPAKRRYDRASLAVVRHHYATGDLATSLQYTFYPMLHPDPRVAFQVIDDPTLRPILPASLRTDATDAAAAPPWPIRHGSALAGASWAVLASVLMLHLLPRRRMSPN